MKTREEIYEEYECSKRRDILDAMEAYALEAIKADRERIKQKFDDCEYADHVIDGIDNLPIELP